MDDVEFLRNEMEDTHQTLKDFRKEDKEKHDVITVELVALRKQMDEYHAQSARERQLIRDIHNADVKMLIDIHNKETRELMDKLAALMVKIARLEVYITIASGATTIALTGAIAALIQVLSK